jgi:hypothetical protein
VVKAKKVRLVNSGPLSLRTATSVSLFEDADDLLISKSELFHSRYSPKLADFVPSLWYSREGQFTMTTIRITLQCS